MKKSVFLLLLFIASCATEKDTSKYLRWVGDIESDKTLDDPTFELCRAEDLVKQYFHFEGSFQYEGEKPALVKAFMENYKAVPTDQSGWIRIRFIVNCKGEAGRFRIISSDKNYQEQVFDLRITDQLLTVTKGLTGWQPQANGYGPQDYYQYLIFKIDKGNLIEILP